MRHTARLEQIHLELKQLKAEFKSGTINRDTYHLTKCKLALERFEIVNLIDGLGSPSERKERDAAPRAEIPPVDEFAVSPVIRRVLERFNHLTIDEAVAFARAVKANSGSTPTHGGVYAPTRRRWSSTSRRFMGRYDVYCSWTCCNSVVADDATPTHVTFVRCRKSEEPSHGVYEALENSAHSCPDGECKNPELHKSAPDLTNRNPIGRCDRPAMFYLLTVVA